MSLSAIPRALARAISRAALAARSDCAADAVLCLDSTDAEISAKSGFLDTVASPVVITPGSKEEVVDVAEGEVNRMEGGLLTASTASVAASAQSVAAEAEKTTVRKVDCILRSSCRVNAASHAGVTGSLDSGQPPEPPGRGDRIGGGQRHI